MKHYFGKISFVIILMLLFAGQTVSAGPGNEINPPVIETNLPAVSYLSPSSSTDINDSISFTLSAQASERMVVKGIRLNIYDSGGQLVYTKEIGEAEQQPFFQRMLIGVGVARLKVEYELPPSLTWSGVTTSGGSLQEGIYSLEIEGWDDRGRTGKSDRYTVIIDNTDPYVEVTLPYSIFSPNSDGNKDILIIEQRGSSEALWQGVIYDTSGAEITTFSWRDEEPGNAIWDGLTNLGSRADDGQYNYQVSATDLAGNSVSFSFENVIVDTRDTPVSLGRDVAYFSPNGDDSIDSLTFLPDVPVQEGLKEWVITISDSKGTPVREYKGQNAVPEEVVFDGRNSSRRVLQEGAYRGHLSVLYTNGNNPTAYSPDFTIDLTAPTVSVKVFPLIFSPNGDGKKDEIQIYQETSEEDSWTGVIADSSGKTVRSFTWRGRSDSQLIWNGRDGKNEMVLDGSYTYTLSTYDKAGNYAAAKSVAFNLDTRVTPVKLAIDGTYFSPNADGNKDTITILPEIEDPIGLEQMTVKILDRADIVVRTFTGNRPLESIVWDGKTDWRELQRMGNTAPTLSSYIPMAIIQKDVPDRLLSTRGFRKRPSAWGIFSFLLTKTEDRTPLQFAKPAQPKKISGRRQSRTKKGMMFGLSTGRVFLSPSNGMEMTIKATGCPTGSILIRSAAPMPPEIKPLSQYRVSRSTPVTHPFP